MFEIQMFKRRIAIHACFKESCEVEDRTVHTTAAAADRTTVPPKVKLMDCSFIITETAEVFFNIGAQELEMLVQKKTDSVKIKACFCSFIKMKDWFDSFAREVWLDRCCVTLFMAHIYFKTPYGAKRQSKI